MLRSLFDIREVFYAETGDIICEQSGDSRTWQVSVDKVNQLKQLGLCVLNFSNEHWGTGAIDYIYNSLTDQNLNFILLSHVPADHKRLPNLFFFPHFYHFTIKTFAKYTYFNSLEKKFKWSCLNGRPKIHRIYNYIYSRKQPYWSDAWFSMHNTEFGSPTIDQIELDADTLNEWESIKTSLPSNGKKILPFHATEATTNSYVHLVTESTVSSGIFVTEKTWRPISQGQIFLVFGPPGTISFLRSLGVDVFDDLIDHSYDYEPDWKIRCHKIHDQLTSLLKMDLPAVYAATQQRRKDNRNKFLSKSFDTQFLSDILKRIDEKLS